MIIIIVSTNPTPGVYWSIKKEEESALFSSLFIYIYFFFLAVAAGTSYRSYKSTDDG
jgi:hypothetical protein